jgi:hypothetical protein
MQLDDLKAAWAAHTAILERSLAIDERILRELLLRKVRGVLWPYVLGRALEVALALVLLLVVTTVLAAHAAEPRYLVVAGALAMFTVGVAAQSAYLAVNVLLLDYGGPVTAIQRSVERLELVEYRATKWALLGGVMLWLPAALVLFEAVTGQAPLARVELGFLALNLGFGLVVLVLGQVLSRRYVERSDLSPAARRIVEALSGRALRSAAGHLAELTRFEREEPAG